MKATLLHNRIRMNRSVDPAKRNEQILLDLLKHDSNKYCADCSQKGTRWASWNIGVFLCIRCGGLHRSLGTHISRVKSVTLDKWTDEQVESIKSKGNAKVNMLYNPNAEKHPFPTFSGDMENYIRDKYERKLFVTDNSYGNSGSMSLKSNNLMDLESSCNSKDFDFKPSIGLSEPSDAHYTKQLTLLNEMGFSDNEFNYKTLRAANGNMQEALEIIVATNQKQRRKHVDRNNLFDELEEPSPKQIANIVEDDNISFKTSPPIHMDDWVIDSETILKSEKVEMAKLTSKDKDEIVVNNNRPKNPNNPWDDDFVEDSSGDKVTKSKEDPFDTYKAFKSNTDNYFDNPW